ncbi:MAG: tetratricopeptide repeat protein, partial [Candidatus Margulisbacteria bacterium]|nr:tetratricopeptide repeat protein [Candidatus Margulisiibacteriota bacterium]
MGQRSAVYEMRRGLMSGSNSTVRRALVERVNAGPQLEGLRPSQCTTRDMFAMVVNPSVLNNVVAYKPIADFMAEHGLENPYNITNETVQSHVHSLLSRYRIYIQNEPQAAPLKIAFLFLCSIVHPTKQIKIEGITLNPSFRDNASFYEADFCTFRGAAEEEGGLEVIYSEKADEKLRQKCGNPLPHELIDASKEERVATCCEFSNLLISMLRIAGIKAELNLVRGETHANVIVTIGNKYYCLDPAEARLERLSVKPDTVVGDNIGIFKHYANEAYWRANQGDLDKAIEMLELLLKWGLNDPIIFNNLGLSFIQRNREGDIDKAIRCFDISIAINKQYLQAVNNKALAMIMSGRLIDAKNYLHEVIDEHPTNAYAYCYLGEVLVKLRYAKEAMRAFNAAITAGPDQVINYIDSIEPADRTFFLWQLMGEAYSRNKDYATARGMFMQAIKMNNRSTAAWLGLAKVNLMERTFISGFIG